MFQCYDTEPVIAPLRQIAKVALSYGILASTIDLFICLPCTNLA